MGGLFVTVMKITKQTDEDGIEYTVPPQEGIKVYLNYLGEITIEGQEEDWGPNLLSFAPHHAKAVCSAIRNVAKLASRKGNRK